MFHWQVNQIFTISPLKNIKFSNISSFFGTFDFSRHRHLEQIHESLYGIYSSIAFLSHAILTEGSPFFPVKSTAMARRQIFSMLGESSGDFRHLLLQLWSSIQTGKEKCGGSRTGNQKIDPQPIRCLEAFSKTAHRISLSAMGGIYFSRRNDLIEMRND